VAQDEVPLEVGTLAWWNDDVLELPDAGRDSVDRFRARRQPVDEGAAGAQGPLTLQAVEAVARRLDRPWFIVDLDGGRPLRRPGA